jgi:hypothetical protein
MYRDTEATAFGIRPTQEAAPWDHVGQCARQAALGRNASAAVPFSVLPIAKPSTIRAAELHDKTFSTVIAFDPPELDRQGSSV